MALQREYTVADLPEGGLDAHAQLLADHLADIRAILGDEMTQALAIVLPPAGPDHDDWRQALAGDLAREYEPKRVNIVGADPGHSLTAVLEYLRDAPGVTGHYTQTHE
ncbi:MAG: hypothetical protein SXU28_06770 [Pseudomonadota bacterium]|nr:hypothetical protein [Pseudomonadota bacterium]